MNPACDQFAWRAPAYERCLLAAAVAGLRLIPQIDRADARRDVEARTAFEADRLQRNCSVGAAYQHVGADPDPDRGASGRADKVAGERARREVGGWRQHRPDEHTGLRKSDIDPEPLDGACVMFRSARSGKSAAQRSGGAEDKAPAARHIAGKRSYLGSALSERGCPTDDAADKQTERPGRHTKPFVHRISFPFAIIEPLPARSGRFARPGGRVGEGLDQTP